ncbi:PAS domain-containing protein [Terrilactibacillus sp. S3-3]|nr:PAS domain-containing protein [Terrilactibacillus sp. S3-3]
MNNDIKETQLDFEQLVEHSLDGIVVIKEGKIIYANKAAKELFSIRAAKKEEKMIGRSVTSLLHPHFVAAWDDKIRKIVYDGSSVELMELTMVKNGWQHDSRGDYRRSVSFS